MLQTSKRPTTGSQATPKRAAGVGPARSALFSPTSYSPSGYVLLKHHQQRPFRHLYLDGHILRAAKTERRYRNSTSMVHKRLEFASPPRPKATQWNTSRMAFAITNSAPDPQTVRNQTGGGNQLLQFGTSLTPVHPIWRHRGGYRGGGLSGARAAAPLVASGVERFFSSFEPF